MIGYNKLISSVIVVICLVRISRLAGLEGFFYGMLKLLMPFAFIWFGEEIGSWQGWVISHGSFSKIDQPTPGILLKIIGWVVLLIIAYSLFHN